MVRLIICLLVFFYAAGYTHAQQGTEAEKDTIYYFSPVIIYPTQALDRETPATFTDLDREKIAERYSVQDIPALLSELPSMTFYSENGNGIGYNYINLRGFDQRRLSVMINGVPQNDPEDHNVYWIDFPDLLASTEMIQVQRGAGSAFYGPPAIGGSVNLVTNPFSMKEGIKVETMFGFQEFGDSSIPFPLATKKYSVSINSGLIDQRYMLYSKLAKLSSSGYRKNSWVEMDSYFLGAVRSDKNMTTRLHFFGGPFKDGLAYTGLPKFVMKDKKLRRQNLAEGWIPDPSGKGYLIAQERREQETESFSQPHYELIHEWKLYPALSLANTFFYYTGNGYFDYDASWADTSMLRIGYTYGIPADGNPADALVRAYVGNKQWGWLPHVTLNHGRGSLSLGAEIRVHRSLHWGKIQFAGGLPLNFDPDYHFYEYNGSKEIFSFYIHELYRIRRHLNLMVDLQVVHLTYGIGNEKFLRNNFDISYTFANPRIGINYNADDNLNFYASAAYTSREPRLKNLYAAEYSSYGNTPQFKTDTAAALAKYDFDKPFAKPEHLLDIELGAGYHNTSVNLTANIYWMEFTDELLEGGEVDLFGQPITWNADRTRHVGLEIDGSVFLSKYFCLNGNLSVSLNKIIRHRIYLGPYESDGGPVYVLKELDGNPISGFPNSLGNLRITWKNDYITAAFVSKYVGSFHTDNYKDENNKNDAYTVFSTEASYRIRLSDRTDVTVRLEIRNLFNRLYFMHGQGNAFFPAAERNYIIGMSANF